MTSLRQTTSREYASPRDPHFAETYRALILLERRVDFSHSKGSLLRWSDCPVNRERGGSFHSNVTLLELIKIHSYVRVRFYSKEFREYTYIHTYIHTHIHTHTYGIRTKSHWTKTHRTISKRTKSKEDKNPGGQNPMGTNAQGDNIQVRQKPRGTKAQGDKTPQGQKPMEDNIQADNIPGGQNPKICVFVLGACVYCIGASRT